MKVKATFTSIPLSSLPSKNAYHRMVVPHPANLSLASLSQSSKTRSTSNFNQLNNTQNPTLQINGTRLTPLDIPSNILHPNDQQLKISPCSNDTDNNNTIKKTIKRKINIKPQLSMATNFHNKMLDINMNENSSSKLSFLSKQYFLLKGQKMLLERSIDRIKDFIYQINQCQSLADKPNSQFKINPKLNDTYSKLQNFLNSLVEFFEEWNTETYGSLFKQLPEKAEILQSFLGKLSSIEKSYHISHSGHHQIPTSKSLSISLNVNLFQKNLKNFNTNTNNGFELVQNMINEIQKIISNELSGVISISRVRSAVCFSIKREKSNKNKGAVKNTPIGDFTESFLGEDTDNSNLPEQQQKELISEIQKIDKNEENFICRICEEVVPLDLIEEHSALCIKAHQGQYHFYLCGEKLKKVQRLLAEKVFSINWPADQEQALNVIFPVLFYYSLIGIAIDVQNADCDANSQLETIIHELSDWEIPEAESQNYKIYIAGRQLVNKKFQYFNEIVNAAKKISSTTRRHRASTTGGFLTNLSDFEFIARLSSGAYARVFLSRKSRTGDLFAIKVIKREHMSQKNQIKSVSAERDIMRRLNSQFIVYFYYSFIEKNNLYLVMEYLPGGDIYSLLQTVGSLSEENARTYTIQLVKALEFLRESGIVHRDLKPDNILISEKGYIKLADFGLSYFGVAGQNFSSSVSQTSENVVPTTSSIFGISALSELSAREPFDPDSFNANQSSDAVGTPDYMAPEVIMSKKHTFTADYWSLGTIVFEMLCGIPPFHGDDESDTFQRIMTGHVMWNNHFIVDSDIPIKNDNNDSNTNNNYEEEDDEEEDAKVHISPEALDFMKKLLVVNPEKRLGAHDIKEIMHHPWFKNVNWNNLTDLPPVFTPDTSRIESYKDYFQDRSYHFENDDESDIIEDINLAKKQEPIYEGHNDMNDGSSSSPPMSIINEAGNDELPNSSNNNNDNNNNNNCGINPNVQFVPTSSLPTKILISRPQPANCAESIINSSQQGCQSNRAKFANQKNHFVKPSNSLRCFNNRSESCFSYSKLNALPIEKQNKSYSVPNSQSSSSETQSSVSSSRSINTPVVKEEQQKKLTRRNISGTTKSANNLEFNRKQKILSGSNLTPKESLDDLISFPTVSFEHLKSSNEEIAKKMRMNRRRAQTESEDATGSPLASDSFNENMSDCDIHEIYDERKKSAPNLPIPPSNLNQGSNLGQNQPESSILISAF